MAQRKFILPLIVLAQFLCTSLWFAGNGVMPDLIEALNLQESDLGYITSSVQFGFIIGTLFYAFFTIADRFNPSKVFFTSALLGAMANLLIVIDGVSFSQVLIFRFLTGFFLAGIYPVGMKIASDYYEKGLGRALSFLVGALVLGTALPHLLASFETSFSWKSVIYLTTFLAITGGLLIWIFVGIGPFRKKGQRLKFSSLKMVFSNADFRAAAVGYFGHMWELYAFWAFVPIMIRQNGHLRFYDNDLISFQSFLIIVAGALACVLAGFLSDKFGSKRIAKLFLLLSGMCCLVSPIGFELDRPYFIGFMIFWGMVVIADSPLFSTLVANESVPELKGTSLTIVTCIGFFITIVSIQLINHMFINYDERMVFLPLIIGPIIGLIAMRNRRATSSSS